MMVLLCILGYLAVSFGYRLWDAWIGTPLEYDPQWTYPSQPPVWLASLAWPICIPISLLVTFGNYVSAVKEKREHKEEATKKLRIAAQKEMDRYMEEVEQEMKGMLRNERKG